MYTPVAAQPKVTQQKSDYAEHDRQNSLSQSGKTWRFTLHPSRGSHMMWCLLITIPSYCELSLRAPWKPWSDLNNPSIPCGLSALYHSGLAVMDGRGTFNLLGIVDDEIAVPYDGEVHCQVTDLNALVHVLKSKNRLSRREEKGAGKYTHAR